MILPAPEQPLPAGSLGRVHFVGIGGAGLSGMARILLARGHVVTGSDIRESATLTALRALGATIWTRHDPAHVLPADTVVVSTAIPADNVEVVAARAHGVRLVSRATALAAMMAGYRVLAVAGAHGKTTTSSMATVALQHCGCDPSFAIGGNFNDTGSNAHHGSGEVFVVEADESDRAFLEYSPLVAVVTNVDPDHLENYGGSRERYVAAFDRFVDRIVPGGYLVAGVDDPGARALAGRARAAGVDVRSYGEAADADVRIVDVELAPLSSRLRLVAAGDCVGPVEIRVPGRHHAQNAAAAFTAVTGLGLPPQAVLQGLAAYTGTRRRFEYKGAARGVRVFDDYGHHPTEMVATLTAARRVAGDGRLVVCFRPLRFARTKFFHRELGAALGLADEVVVLDPTGDEPIPGITGVMVSAHVPLPAGRVRYEPSFAAAPARVAAVVRPGDTVITLGAADVATVGPELLTMLAEAG